jgi:NAD(P)H-nitrite reductase large subunit
MNFVIIGDGVAGAPAAETIRDESEESEIHVFTDESEPLYNRIMLKSYMKGDLPDKKFTRMHDEKWYDKRDIELHLETRIETVEEDEKNVVTATGEAFEYDKLLVATGGSPRRLSFDEDYDNLHYMWTMQDATEIKEAAAEADRAVVIGGGLLGIDLAVAYAEHDCETFYLIRGSNWWSRGLDDEGAEIIHRKLEEKGVNVMTETEAVKFKGNDTIEEVELDSGESIEDIDSVSVAIGQTPNSGIVDVEKNDSDMIKADRFLNTSDDDIYAAGNMVEYYSPVFQRRIVNGSWDHSEAMGKCAAKNMMGEKTEFDFVNTYGVGHFDVQFLAIGDWTGEPVSRKYDENNYRRLFLRDGKLVGAIMIGKTDGQERLRSSIENGEKFSKEEFL